MQNSSCGPLFLRCISFFVEINSITNNEEFCLPDNSYEFSRVYRFEAADKGEDFDKAIKEVKKDK